MSKGILRNGQVVPLTVQEQFELECGSLMINALSLVKLRAVHSIHFRHSLINENFMMDVVHLDNKLHRYECETVNQSLSAFQPVIASILADFLTPKVDMKAETPQ
jgi:hypothetical protein